METEAAALVLVLDLAVLDPAVPEHPLALQMLAVGRAVQLLGRALPLLGRALPGRVLRVLPLQTLLALAHPLQALLPARAGSMSNRTPSTFWSRRCARARRMRTRSLFWCAT